MGRKSLRSVGGLASVLAIAAVLNLVPSGGLLAGGGPECAGIYNVEGDVQKPIRLTGPAPVYPEEARKERIQGMVVVKAVIDHEGKVVSTEVVESAREDLDAAAAEAIGAWTFEPATLKGEPVSVYYNLTVNFRLERGETQKADDDDQEPSLR